MKPTPLMLAAIILASAGPALSAPAQPPRSSTAEAAAVTKAQKWLNELAAWSLPLNPILMQNVDVMSHLLEGATTAAKFHDEGQFEAGKAWATPWAEEANAKLDGLSAKRTALPGPPPSLPAELVELKDMEARLAHAPAAIRAVDTLLANSVAGGRRYVTMIAETASGSEGARAALPGLGLDTAITLIRGENSFSEFSKLTTMPGHPQYDLVDASLHSNLAAIALLEYQRGEVYGEEPDRSAFAARIRAEADACLAAARSVRSNAKSAQASLRQATGASASLASLVERAVATYADSATVEEDIAAALHRMADGVERGENLDVGPVKAAADALQELTLKRAAIDTRRRELLAGKP